MAFFKKLTLFRVFHRSFFLAVSLVGMLQSGVAAADVSIFIDYAGILPNKTVNNIAWQPGMTAGDAMDTAQSQGSLTFTYQTTTGIGRYVTDIDGVQEVSATGPWWLFCVNGITSRVGIDHKVLLDGDAVEWHYTADFPPCPTESRQPQQQNPAIVQ